MLSSIHPLGEAGRGNQYPHTAAAFVVGSVLGGLTTGSVLGLVGVPVSASGGVLAADWVRVAVPVVLLCWFGLGTRWGWRPPSPPRQVNEDWLTEYRSWVYGLGFGWQLGAGVTTWIRSTLVWVWLACVVLVGSLGWALVLGTMFGLVRGLSILTTRGVRSPEDLIQFHRNLHRLGSRRPGFALVEMARSDRGLRRRS